MLRLKVRLNPMGGSRTIYINRAPVLTLWAAVVAERLGFRRDEALTLVGADLVRLTLALHLDEIAPMQ